MPSQLLVPDMLPRREAGFTLIELLVVFAIVALLIALVPPAFDRMREGAIYRDTVRTMLADMRTARRKALDENVDTRFSIDLENRLYGIEGRAMHTIDPSMQLRAIVAGEETNAQRKATIRFLATGGATGGTIEVVRASGAGVRLRVDWLFGSVQQEPLSP